ncbi:MAG: TIGR02206 family membrane protein [Flavobacteriaceae bacterium]|nr:TIGR02206 family membrane protein [Flavobacteriaceae bacterium]
MDTYTIDFLSIEWFRNTSISFFCICFFLTLGRSLNEKQNLKIAKLLSFILLLSTLFSHTGNVVSNQWTIREHLPLHLCSINGLICITILFIKNNKSIFEFSFYAGVIGGIVALLTPQINDYDRSILEYLVYYVSHSLIILIPFYLLLYLNFKLRPYSWFKTILNLNLLMIVLMPINYLIKSNYMYLNKPPEVNNPLIIGEWPYYLIYFEVFILILFFMTFWIFRRKKRF